jgi:hypothetical protein
MLTSRDWVTARLDGAGLQSDFDSASMPQGMEDCSKLPQNRRGAPAQGLQRRRHPQNSGGQLTASHDAKTSAYAARCNNRISGRSFMRMRLQLPRCAVNADMLSEILLLVRAP